MLLGWKNLSVYFFPLSLFISNKILFSLHNFSFCFFFPSLESIWMWDCFYFEQTFVFNFCIFTLSLFNFYFLPSSLFDPITGNAYFLMIQLPIGEDLRIHKEIGEFLIYCKFVIKTKRERGKLNFQKRRRERRAGEWGEKSRTFGHRHTCQADMKFNPI